MCDPRTMASLVRQYDFFFHALQLYAVLITVTCVYLVVLSVRRKH
jgi:hypothetical protein